MSMPIRLASGLLLCGAIISAGCGWAKRKPYDNDPLLLHQKPVMGALPADTKAVATQAEPYAPPRPPFRDEPTFIHTIAQSISQAPAPYRHAPDYSWLQGTLDIHHRGFRALRFADINEEDRYGGKVRFADDARLRGFAEGDVIRVEGELIGAGPQDDGLASAYPLYRVRSVRLIQSDQ